MQPGCLFSFVLVPLSDLDLQDVRISDLCYLHKNLFDPVILTFCKSKSDNSFITDHSPKGRINQKKIEPLLCNVMKM